MNLRLKKNFQRRSCLILAIYYILVIANGKPLDLANLNSTQGFEIINSNGEVRTYNGANIGDLNGDHIDDLLLTVIDPNVVDGLRDHQIYILYGNTTSRNLTIDISEANSSPYQGFWIKNLGYVYEGIAKCAGDLNEDGVNDIIRKSLNKNHPTELVLVIYGNKDPMLNIDVNSADFTPNQGFRILDSTIDSDDSTQDGGLRDVTINRAGDVNGDGIDDIVIGFAGKDTYRGIAYVIFGSKNPILDIDVGSASFSPNQGFRIWNSKYTNYEKIGFSVSFAGDVNGDNIDDVIISCPHSPGLGLVYVIFGRTQSISDVDVGSSNFAPNQGFKIFDSSVTDFSLFGYDIRGAGDMNGDGVDDFLITDYQRNHYRGIVYVVYGSKTPILEIDLGSATFSPSQGFKIWNSKANINHNFGWIVDIIDINGDHLNDIIISEPADPSFGSPSAYVIYGSWNPFQDFDVSENFSSDLGFRIWNSFSKFRFSGVGSNAGDINGDGISDMAIPGSSQYGGASTTFVIYGKKLECPNNCWSCIVVGAQNFRLKIVFIFFCYFKL